LDSFFRVGVEPEDGGLEAEIEERNAALPISSSEEESNCMERVSTMEMELPEGNAMRPWGLRSADPKLLRLGGPGSIDSHDSCGWAVTVGGALGLASIIHFTPLRFRSTPCQHLLHYFYAETSSVAFCVSL